MELHLCLGRAAGWASSPITGLLDALGQDIASFCSLVSLFVNIELRTGKLLCGLLANLQRTS